MKRCVELGFILLLLFLACNVSAQDTLKEAKTLLNQGKFKESEKLLKPYYDVHASHLNTAWLYGQAVYGAKHVGRFKSVYKKAINLFPDNLYLQLDYSFKLIDIGELNSAYEILNAFYQSDSTSVKVNMALAKLTYWQGDYALALTFVNRVLKSVVTEEAQELKTRIINAKSPWLQAEYGRLFDDQPLTMSSYFIKHGKFVNKRWTVGVEAGATTFLQANNQANFATLTNQLHFSEWGLQANINLGGIQFLDSSYDFTAGLQISKTLGRHATLTAQLARIPYFTTLSSLQETILYHQSALTLDLGRQTGFFGQLSGSRNRFLIDDNYITNLSGWMFAPPMNISRLQLRVGYAYGYSTSEYNRYEAKDSIVYIGNGYEIEGVYSPYFTPSKQTTHAGLASLHINVTSTIKIGFNGSFSFYGKTYNPYLFPATGINNTFVDQGFHKTNFYPNEWSAYVLGSFKDDRILLKLSYKTLQNNFYKSEQINLTAKFILWELNE